MLLALHDIRQLAFACLKSRGHAGIATRAAGDCAWLEAVGYPGLKLLSEALDDEFQHINLEKDLMGLDLKNVSCIYLADQIAALYAEHGRLFLSNVRHGLYVVPMSVRGNFGIGCPVDPAFALGGERHKNPYSEKLDAAERSGVVVDDVLWQSLQVPQEQP